MIKFFIKYIALLLWANSIWATHNRAGEITYRHIGGYTYEFTITTYTYALSNAKRSELTISWGDGSETEVPILDPPGFYLIPGTDYLKNTYIANHTFSGAGVYKVLMEDPNRNQGVDNIPNSVNTIFSIQTILMVGSNTGQNSAPELLNPPIDKAARGHIFIHNPAAYDPDGDSLSYAITTCTGAGGNAIEGYTIPAATDTLFIDETVGDLTWITPPSDGVFNIAILVEEWRKGLRIGRIARDIQVDVYETDNNPPENIEIPNLCVVAGETININIETTDADNDPLIQSMVGGPFVVNNPAVYTFDSSGYGWLYSHFSWNTDCNHARKQPYTLVLKTEDVTGDINLVDITSFTITVLHLPPENITLLPSYDKISVTWTNSGCGTPIGYNVYRRIGSITFVPDECETGVPGDTGYELVEFVDGENNTTYTDDNQGAGLEPGFEFCYRVTAVYADGAESITSEEVCTRLVPGNPPILKVSVLNDHETDGSIELAWAVPKGDDVIDDGPYRYEIQRKAPGEADFASIHTTELSSGLSDTTYIDTDINTMIFPYTYTVILQYQEGGTWHSAERNEQATTQYINIEASDNMLSLEMLNRSPWRNESYDIYRKNGTDFDSISTSIEPSYIDSNLINGTTYTYRTIGEGYRPLYGINYSTNNISHLASGIPIDTIGPCPPDLFVTSECDSVVGYNLLTWNRPVGDCANQDIVGYIISSRDSMAGEFIPRDTVEANRFKHPDYPENSIEQCYTVTAIDSVGNKGVSNTYCVYNLCGLFSLPNVFTPNSDGVNDKYVSWNFNGYIKQVDMKIYNRYGKEVYATDNPDIEWDGTYNNNLVSTGVYFYTCDVFEPRIGGTLIITLKGFIHVYSGETNNIIE